MIYRRSPADEGDVNRIVVFFKSRYFFDVLQDFIEEIAEIHKVDSRDPDGIA